MDSSRLIAPNREIPRKKTRGFPYFPGRIAGGFKVPGSKNCNGLMKYSPHDWVVFHLL